MSNGEPRIYWKNRTRMAWIALCSILLVTYLAFFHVDVERLKILEQVITWFYFIMGGIVTAFMGFQAAFDAHVEKLMKGKSAPATKPTEKK